MMMKVLRMRNSEKRSRHGLISMKMVEWIHCRLRSLGPYLAVALYLPGGSQ